jgi:hypothetical protein
MMTALISRMGRNGAIAVWVMSEPHARSGDAVGHCAVFTRLLRPGVSSWPRRTSTPSDLCLCVCCVYVYTAQARPLHGSTGLRTPLAHNAFVSHNGVARESSICLQVSA